MTFLDLVTHNTHAAQPDEPTSGKPCHNDDGADSVGWVWTGNTWAPGCPAHMQVDTRNRIWNSEYGEDW